MPNSSHTHSQQNIFIKQSKTGKANKTQKTLAPKTREVWQDKGVLTNARAEAGQPAPLTKGSRARELNTNTPRAQKTNPSRVKLQHTTFHLHPLARKVAEQKAAEAGVSLSSIGNQVMYDWALSTIKRQEETTLKAELRQIIREEHQAFGHRIVYFLMRIAFSAEQARILITNVLKLVVKLTGGDQKSYFTLVDESGKLAKRNILANTPQFKTLLEEWDKGEEKKEAKTN